MTKAELEKKLKQMEYDLDQVSASRDRLQETAAFYDRRAMDAMNEAGRERVALHQYREKVFAWSVGGGCLALVVLVGLVMAGQSATDRADVFEDRCERVVNASAVSNQGISPAVTYLCDIPLPERK